MEIDITLQNRIVSLMHAELASRLLIQYFVGKEMEDFGLPLNPMMISDLAKAIPELSRKVEVIPYVYKLDPLTGSAELGWNLFVLGSSRMYLGKTKHKRLGELVSQSAAVDPGEAAVELATTPKDVIKFICNTLKKSEDGQVDLGYSPATPQFMKRPMLATPTSSYYEKRRWGR